MSNNVSDTPQVITFPLLLYRGIAMLANELWAVLLLPTLDLEVNTQFT